MKTLKFWIKCILGFYIMNSIIFFTIIWCFRSWTEIDLFLQINLGFILFAALSFISFFAVKNYFSNELRYVILLFVIASMLVFQSSQFLLLNIDRSRSFYVISWVKNHDIAVTFSGYDLLEVKSDEKMSQSAIANRIDEQVDRGFITVESSHLELSKVGLMLYVISDRVAGIFRLDGWLINKL